MINILNKIHLKVFLTIFISLFLVNFLAQGERELTPRILAGKIINLFPSQVRDFFYKKEVSPPFAQVVLSKEKLEKVKLYYNNEEFEVYIDKEVELTQEKVKLLYSYWKLVNKKQ